MHGCFNLFCSIGTGFFLLLWFCTSCHRVCSCWKGFFVVVLHELILHFWDFLGWLTCCPNCHSLIELQSVFQRPKRTCLRTHGGVGPLQITCAWTQPSWSGRRCPTSTTRAAVLSSMVWAHAISDLAIATDVTASVSTSVSSSVQQVSTSVSSSVQHATVGTLCWKSIHESDLCLAVGHMAQSTVSTGTSFISSTHLGISISRSPINSTMLTHIALSTYSSGIAQHSIHSIIPAPSSWHSICELTWWSNNGWWQPHLWLWSQSSLARGQRPLRQSEDQRPDFPRCIRQSAFTQKLDIEGCDPLKLPVAALLYQQANNFWLRKLAHGREVYLIPTGDIAAVVFMTELLTQLRNKGVDMDKVASCKARQDGKLLDKTNNTKHAAQQVADLIHSWVPTRTADPDTQHELTQLRSQLAQLRQQLGETTGEPSTPNTTGTSASSPASAPIHAALLRNSQSPAPPAPPGFDPSPVPLSIRGLLKTSHHLLQFEPLTNGWKNSISPNLKRRFSTTTLPKWKSGGRSNRLKLWTPSNELQPRWASLSISWGRTTRHWTSFEPWQPASASPID